MGRTFLDYHMNSGVYHLTFEDSSSIIVYVYIYSYLLIKTNVPCSVLDMNLDFAVTINTSFINRSKEIISLKFKARTFIFSGHKIAM